MYDLSEKLKLAGIFTTSEVEQFVEAFYAKNKSPAAVANICKPAMQRWQLRYNSAVVDYEVTKQRLEITQRTNEPVLIANAEKEFAEAKKEREVLEIFKRIWAVLHVSMSLFLRSLPLMTRTLKS